MNIEKGITVSVGRPGNVRRITLEGGRNYTVADVLKAAELQVKRGEEIRLGGEPATMQTTVPDGAQLLISGAMQGGTR